MSDEGEHVVVEQQSNTGKWILILLAIIAVVGLAYAHYTTHQAVQKLNQDLTASQAEVKELQARMQTAEAQEETLAKQAGMTKKELAQRTAELQSAQRAAESRLEAEQKQQISAVSGDIAGVKTDVGGVKTDVASTKADLEATKADCKVRSAIWACRAGDRRQHALRPGNSQAQGRSQLLRIHAAERREAAAGGDCEPATEED